MPNYCNLSKDRNNPKPNKTEYSEAFIPVQPKGNSKPKIHRMKEIYNRKVLSHIHLVKLEIYSRAKLVSLVCILQHTGLRMFEKTS